MSRYEIARNDTPTKKKRNKKIKAVHAENNSVSKVIIGQDHVVREIQNAFRAPDIEGIPTQNRGRTLGISSPGGYKLYIPVRNLNARLIETSDHGLEFAIRVSYREGEALMRDVENATRLL
jgi:hypothetical protein